MSAYQQAPLFHNNANRQVTSHIEPVSAAESEIHGVTELRLNSNQQLAKSILSGMLLELSENADQRWLCWVADRPLKPLLQTNNRATTPNRILQVVSNKPHCSGELARIAIRALERGKSHTVAILVNGEVCAADKRALARAARRGDAECLLIQLS